jgi:hypothetical protein
LKELAANPSERGVKIKKRIKMNIDDLTFGQIKEIQAIMNCNSGTKNKGPFDHGIAVVVADRGFVYVGRTTTDGEWCNLTNASNIRIWGTKKGLGELVLNGPQKDTRLDKVGSLKIPLKAIISIHESKENLWKE